MTSILMQSERLHGRELQLSDLEEFTDMQSNPNVMGYVGQDVMSPEECKQDLLKVLSHYKANDGFRVWGFFLKDSDELVGTGALISNEKGHELGYRLREKFWQQGYGSEIGQAVIDYSFQEFGIDQIFAEVDQRNIGSVKILDKIMIRIKAFWNETDKTDDYYYELSKADYEKIRH